MRLSRVTAAIALAFTTATADARTLDRVVAVVGDRIILLSEVQVRARPYVTLAARQQKDPLALARLSTKALHDACERLIDEALIEDEASRQHLAVSSDELDKAIAGVAKSNNLTLDVLYAEARNQGYDEGAYRLEISHTLLEWKLVQIRTKTTDEKALDAARTGMLAELRARVFVEDRLAP